MSKGVSGSLGIRVPTRFPAPTGFRYATHEPMDIDLVAAFAAFQFVDSSHRLRDPNFLGQLRRELDMILRSVDVRETQLAGELEMVEEWLRKYKKDESEPPKPIKQEITNDTFAEEVKSIVPPVSGSSTPAVLLSGGGTSNRKRKIRDETTAEPSGTPAPLNTVNPPSVPIQASVPLGSSSKSARDLKKKKQRAESEDPLVNPPPGSSAQGDEKEKPAELEDNLATAKPVKTGAVTVETFWKFIDNFFRPVNDADMMLLEPTKEEDPSIYAMPPLGRHYTQVFMDEDNGVDSHAGGFSAFDALFANNVPMDDNLCGEITERLVSALVEERLVPSLSESESGGLETEDSSLPGEDEPPTDVPPMMLGEFEDRVRKELRHAGLLEKDLWNISRPVFGIAPGANDGLSHDVYSSLGPMLTGSAPLLNAATREDNEVCVEIRRAQADLKRWTIINNWRRRKLKSLVEPYLGYQDFRTVSDEINKMIDEAYLRRMRVASKKKPPPRKSGTTSQAPLFSAPRPNKPVPDSVMRLLSRRKALHERLGPLFPEKVRQAGDGENAVDGLFESMPDVGQLDEMGRERRVEIKKGLAWGQRSGHQGAKVKTLKIRMGSSSVGDTKVSEVPEAREG